PLSPTPALLSRFLPPSPPTPSSALDTRSALLSLPFLRSPSTSSGPPSRSAATASPPASPSSRESCALALSSLRLPSIQLRSLGRLPLLRNNTPVPCPRYFSPAPPPLPLSLLAPASASPRSLPTRFDSPSPSPDDPISPGSRSLLSPAISPDLPSGTSAF